MKYIVCKKGLLSLIPVTILYNIVASAIIIITSKAQQKEATFLTVFFVATIIVLNLTLLYLYRMLGSYIIFENDVVKCVFLKRVRYTIPLCDIKDYGIYWEKGIKFIYVANFKLTENQRINRVFDLYKKTKNIIVFQFNEDAINFISKNIIL